MAMFESTQLSTRVLRDRAAKNGFHVLEHRCQAELRGDALARGSRETSAQRRVAK
jgi:hypothetical protein